MYFCSANTEMRWLVISHAKLKNLQRCRFCWDFARTIAIWLPVGSVGENYKYTPSKYEYYMKKDYIKNDVRNGFEVGVHLASSTLIDN